MPQTGISLKNGLTITAEVDWENPSCGDRPLVVEIFTATGIYRFSTLCVLSYDKEKDTLIVEE